MVFICFAVYVLMRIMHGLYHILSQATIHDDIVLHFHDFVNFD